MNTKTLAALGAVLALAAVYASADPLGTAFTYQGKLDAGTSAANGIYDFQFAVYDAVSGPNLVAGPLTKNSISVSNGLFTTTLDFGAGVFTGTARWLDIAVRPNGGGAFTPLTPRQPLLSGPYALYAPNAASANVAASVAPNGVDTTGLQNGAVTAAKIAGGNVVKSLNSLKDDVTLAQGANVTVSQSGQTLTLASPTDWHIAGNVGTTPGVNFLGTTDNQALELHINSTRALRLEPNTYAENNTIGGAWVNTVDTGVVGATIGGGGSWNRGGHQISANYGTIAGGGYGNQIRTNADNSTIGGGAANLIYSNAFQSTIAGGFYHHILEDAYDSTIGGGWQNEIQQKATGATIAGGYLSTIQPNAGASTIGGGVGNRIQTNASNSTIAGGVANVIQHDSFSSVIGGGQNNAILPYVGGGVIGGGSANTNGGSYATVPGGQNNLAGGTYSFAAGRRAKAVNQGAFVWADSQAADFSSTAQDQFLIRAAGNVGINKNNPATALDVNGTVTATSFTGSGAGLTGIAQLANGTAVRSLNGLTDIVTLAGGTNVSVTPSGNTLRLDGPVYTAGNGLALTSLQFSLRPGSTITNDNVTPYAFRAVSPAGYWGNSVGLFGEAGGAALATPASPCGVWGESWTGRGVMGASRSTNWFDGGVHGWGIGVANGVFGVTDTGIGVRGRSEYGGIGVYGESTNGGFAAKFNGAVTVVGVTPDLNVGGALVVDGSGLNTGTIAPGLTFGVNSGEGIASKRTATGNQYGLDFYTGYARRMSLSQIGNLSMYDNTIYLRGQYGDGSFDQNNGLGYRGASIPFASTAPDGPVLFGYSGGALGTEQYGTEKVALTWKSNGYVGIGTNNPAVLLDIYGTNYITGSRDGLINIGHPGGQHITIDGDDIQARYGTSGSTLYFNYWDNSGGVVVGQSGANGYKFYVNGTAYSTGGWSGSDARWKKNVQPVTGALDKINRLQGVTYDWKREEFPAKEFEAGTQLGFLAQDVEKVVPEAVRTDADGYKAIAYEKLTAVLTEGVKEQQAEIGALKARNVTLEKDVAELKALVEKLLQKGNGG